MNVHPLGEHLSTCSGPTNCAEYAAIGRMTSAEFLTWLAADRAHWHAAAPVARHRVAQLRLAMDSARYAPPCGYRAGLEKLRADLITPRDLVDITSKMDPRGVHDDTPPDPYAAGIALLRMKEKR